MPELGLYLRTCVYVKDRSFLCNADQYLSLIDGKCLSCSDKINNCLSCSPKLSADGLSETVTCDICQPYHYLTTYIPPYSTLPI